MAAQIQNTGFANFAAAVVAYASVPKFIGWGTGTGAAVSATDLVTPAAPTSTTRVTGSPSTTTTTLTNDTVTVTGTVTAGGALSITEAGLFTAATGTNLQVYASFGVITLANGDSISFTFNVQFH